MNIPGCLEVATHTDVREIWRQNAPSSLTVLPLSTHFSPASGLLITHMSSGFSCLGSHINRDKWSGFSPKEGVCPLQREVTLRLTETRILMSLRSLLKLIYAAAGLRPLHHSDWDHSNKPIHDKEIILQCNISLKHSYIHFSAPSFTPAWKSTER